MTSLATPPYACDEELALACQRDFALLCPCDQLLARGEAGSFPPGQPWTLLTPATDLASSGVCPGHVVILESPSATFGPAGTLLGIAALDTTALTLKRLGLPAGSGCPPAPLAGLGGVAYRVLTLDPQLAAASAELNQQYGIAGDRPGRTAADLADTRPLRDLAVLTVLAHRYRDLSHGDSSVPDMFQARALALETARDQLAARTVLHWLPTCGPVPPASRFGTRLTR